MRYANRPEDFEEKYRDHLNLTITSEGGQRPTARYSLDELAIFKGNSGIKWTKFIGPVVNKAADFISYGYAYDTDKGVLFVKLKVHEINKGKVPRFCTQLKSSFSLRPSEDFWNKFQKASDVELFAYEMIDEKTTLRM